VRGGGGGRGGGGRGGKGGGGDGRKKNGDSKGRGRRSKERQEKWEFLKRTHGRWSRSAWESEGDSVRDWVGIMPDAR